MRFVRFQEIERTPADGRHGRGAATIGREGPALRLLSADFVEKV
jgi:hypothetical protein